MRVWRAAWINILDGIRSSNHRCDSGPQGLCKFDLVDEGKQAYARVQFEMGRGVTVKVFRKAFVLLELLSLALVFASSGSAAMKLRMGIAGLTNEYIAVWVAKELGRFKEQGIELELITFSGGSTMLQAALAGELSVVFVGGVFVQANRGGADLVTVATPIDTFPYQLVVKSSIQRPEQLEGKKLGISRFGTASEIGLRMALKKVGLDPEKSRVTIMQVGGQTDRFTALRSGVVDGSLFAAPFTGAARKLGFNVLLDMKRLGLLFPQQNIVARKSFVEKNEALIEALVKAYIAGIRDAKIEKEKTIQIMARYLRMDQVKDRELLEDAQSEVAGLLHKKPYPSVEGIKVALGQYSRELIDPGRFIDDRFVRKIDESGFIDSLYP